MAMSPVGAFSRVGLTFSAFSLKDVAPTVPAGQLLHVVYLSI